MFRPECITLLEISNLKEILFNLRFKPMQDLLNALDTISFKKGNAMHAYIMCVI